MIVLHKLYKLTFQNELLTKLLCQQTNSLWILLVCIFIQVNGLAREKQCMNESWQFKRDVDKNWESVDLPHTWNAEDVLDDEKGYYRGGAVYKRKIIITDTKQKQSFLEFEAVGQQFTLLVNGTTIGTHYGGYTSVVFNISKAVQPGTNTIEVHASNQVNEQLIPLEADFNFYGGIYRDVWFYQTGINHFYTNTGGSSGVLVHSQLDSTNFNKAKLEITSTIKLSPSTKADKFIVTYLLYNSLGKKVASFSKTGLQTTLNHSVFQQSIQKDLEVMSWSIDSPNLYKLKVVIDGDTVSQHIGFRRINISKKKGFVLNGQPVKLIGSNRHQDEVGKGNALSNEDHRRDLLMLKQMGINFLRISHYPQDPVVLNLCDSLGILAIEEIPFVNEATVSKEFSKLTKLQLEEMMIRDYNHPSLFAWGTSNELTLQLNRITKNFTDSQRKDYIQFEVDLLTQLDSIIHQLDPNRYSFTVHCCGLERNIKLGYHQADLIGYNKYFGWYEKDVNQLTDFLHDFAELESRPFFLSEYGGGADPRIRTNSPKRFDFSVEWQNHIHQSHLLQLLNSSQFFGANVWNFADFQAEHRNDAVPKINSKGLVTAHRLPKDSYYFYQVVLADEEKVILPAKLYTTRAYLANDSTGEISNQTIEVYSNKNGEIMQLFQNGKIIASNEVREFKSSFTVPFQHGTNQIMAQVGPQFDQETFEVIIFPKKLSRDRLEMGLNINIGAHFTFSEQINSKNIWLPDKAYEPGNYGFVGGSPFLRDSKELVGSDQNILTTNLDPIYQTHRYNMDSYQIDVPDGLYEIELHFAEVLSKNQAKNWLKQQSISGDFNRDFEVWINNDLVSDFTNEFSDTKEFFPMVMKQSVLAKNGTGINIHFNDQAKFPYLSGVTIKAI